MKLDIVSIEDRLKELVINIDTNKEEFLYNFLALYDIPKATINRLKKSEVKEIKNKLLFLEVNKESSVVAEVHNLEKSLETKKSKPRYIIVTNFEDFASKDLKTADTLNIKLNELPAYADFFLAWNGIEKVDYSKESPADLKAAARFTKLYDELKKINTFEDESQAESEFNLFLTRLLFLLFAEDTEIMKKSVLTSAIKTRSKEDGSDLNELFNKIFFSLDISNRTTEELWLQEFPYVNGKLFEKAHTNIVFDTKTRKLILEAGELLDWNEINPDILGSMIQTVANKEQRSVSGMHYTSVENIMKVISPLFLEELKTSYSDIENKVNENDDKDISKDSKRKNKNSYIKKLEELHTRISNIKFLDPACGSGNFLIITYKEMRRLEIRILKLLRRLRDEIMIDFFEDSKITLNNFYGIEVDDFASEVARLSLWIAEHQMNVEAEREINLKQALLPLKDAGKITKANALRVDWNEVLPHNENDEIYLIGNPPYIGAKLQNKEQKEDMKLTIGEKLKYKQMDYISSWFYKGVDFINTAKAKLAFVTTNSIFQGEQVAFVWQPLLEKMEIEFAYTSFKWGNSAANNAGVTVAIVGIANKNNINNNKYIFDENQIKVEVENINAYLSSAGNIIVESSNKPLSELPKMSFGNMPNDGGALILSEEEIRIFDKTSKFIKKYIGSAEFINNKKRYCIWLTKEDYEVLKEDKFIQDRVKKCEEHRLNSKSESARKLAIRPWSFRDTNTTETHSILIPRVSSESREYVPMGFVDSDTIISDSAMAIYNAPVWLLGLLQSRMHMVWLRAIGGKLKTDYRYSAGLVYNTFPVPNLSDEIKEKLEDQVFEILDIREEEGSSLAELYNKKTMPERLTAEHKKLDTLVESIYQRKEFLNDEERLSHLLKLYKEMKESKNV